MAAALAAARPGGTTSPGEQISGSVEERIARIENGLIFNPLAVKGQTAYKLAKQMEYYKVPGVSVASDEKVPTIIQMLDGERPANTPAVRVDTEPGRILRYSGGGFTVMQLLLTDVTGKAFPELMNELVLRPAGMDRSTYHQPLPKDMESSEATPYLTSGEAVKGGPHMYPEGAGGLWTTPSDLGHLALEVEKEYDGLSQKILTPTMAKQYLTVQTRGSWLELGQFGLGIQVKGSGNSLEFMHAGANTGYRCVLVDFPERHQGVAIMTNSDSGDHVMYALLRSIAKEYGWPDYRVIDVTGFVALLFLVLVMFTTYWKLRLSRRPKLFWLFILFY